jgi:hypothetical protein
MSAECSKCGTDIVYPAGTWPLGVCPVCPPEGAVEIHAEHDTEGDLLEIWIGLEPRAAICTEAPDGTLIRHAVDDGSVCGFTIFDWSRR